MKKKKLSFIAALSVFSMTVTSVLPAMAAPTANDAGKAEMRWKIRCWIWSLREI